MGCCRTPPQRRGIQLGHRGLRTWGGVRLHLDLSKKQVGMRRELNVLGVLWVSKDLCFVSYGWLAMDGSASSETRTFEFSGQYELGPLRDWEPLSTEKGKCHDLVLMQRAELRAW